MIASAFSLAALTIAHKHLETSAELAARNAHFEASKRAIEACYKAKTKRNDPKDLDWPAGTRTNLIPCCLDPAIHNLK